MSGMQICMDGARNTSNGKKNVRPQQEGESKQMNFFLSPISFMKDKGVDLIKLTSVNDMHSLINELTPAMSPPIAKAVGDLVNLSKVMGVDLTNSNPLFDDVRKALVEGVKGFLEVKGVQK